MNLYFKDKKIKVPVRKVSEFGKILGLMFKCNKTENLLFNFKKETEIGIHSFFVFFNFLAIWLDKNNKILEFRIVKPFKFIVKPKKSFTKLIEIPSNKKNKKIIEIFVGKGKV